MNKYKPISKLQKDTIIIEKYDSSVARIILNRPDKLNAFSLKQIKDYFVTLEELEKDDFIKVVITTGAGHSFTSGRDINELKSIMSDLSNDSEGFTYYNIFDRVRLYPKVTIAAVNGICLGAGITLLLNNDIAIASLENAKFGLPEVSRGFVPRTQVSSLFKSIPRKWAFDMILTGQNFDAKKALQAGLVSRVVPHAELEEESLSLASLIGSSPNYDPVVLKCIKLGAHYAMDIAEYNLAMEMASNWFRIARESKLGLATELLSRKHVNESRIQS